MIGSRTIIDIGAILKSMVPNAKKLYIVGGESDNQRDARKP